MKGTILLDHNESTHQVELEEKNRFLRDILAQSGVPIDSFWKFDETILSVNQRIQLRNILNSYGIQVIDGDGVMEIFIENELIAKWNKCTYKLKRDYAKKDPRKQLYVEMEIDCWSIFEENP